MSTEHITVRMGLQKTEFNRGLRSAHDDITGIGKAFKGLAKSVSIAAVGYAIAGFMRGALSKAIELREVSDEARRSIDDLKSSWQDMQVAVGKKMADMIAWVSPPPSRSIRMMGLDRIADEYELAKMEADDAKEIAKEQAKIDEQQLKLRKEIGETNDKAIQEQLKARFDEMSDTEKMAKLKENIGRHQEYMGAVDDKSLTYAKSHLAIVKDEADLKKLELSRAKEIADAELERNRAITARNDARSQRGDRSLEDIANMWAATPQGSWNRLAAQEVILARRHGDFAKVNGAPQEYLDRVYGYSDRVASRISGLQRSDRDPMYEVNKSVTEQTETLHRIEKGLRVIPVGNAP